MIGDEVYPCAVCNDPVTDLALDAGNHACCPCGWRDRSLDNETAWRCPACDPHADLNRRLEALLAKLEQINPTERVDT